MSGYRLPRTNNNRHGAESNGHFDSPKLAYLFIRDELCPELRDRMERNGKMKLMRDFIVQGDVEMAYSVFQRSGMSLEDVKQSVASATVELLISGHLGDAGKTMDRFGIAARDLKPGVMDRLEEPMFRSAFTLVESITGIVGITQEECRQPAINAMHRALTEGYPNLAKEINYRFGMDDAVATNMATMEITRRMRSGEKHSIRLIGEIAVAFGLTQDKLKGIAREVNAAANPGSEVQLLLRRA